jgi:hypothetical protein
MPDIPGNWSTNAWITSPQMRFSSGGIPQAHDYGVLAGGNIDELVVFAVCEEIVRAVRIIQPHQ